MTRGVDELHGVFRAFFGEVGHLSPGDWKSLSTRKVFRQCISSASRGGTAVLPVKASRGGCDVRACRPGTRRADGPPAHPAALRAAHPVRAALCQCADGELSRCRSGDDHGGGRGRGRVDAGGGAAGAEARLQGLSAVSSGLARRASGQGLGAGRAPRGLGVGGARVAHAQPVRRGDELEPRADLRQYRHRAVRRGGAGAGGRAGALRGGRAHHPVAGGIRLHPFPGRPRGRAPPDGGPGKLAALRDRHGRGRRAASVRHAPLRGESAAAGAHRRRTRRARDPRHRSMGEPGGGRGGYHVQLLGRDPLGLGQQHRHAVGGRGAHRRHAGRALARCARPSHGSTGCSR